MKIMVQLINIHVMVVIIKDGLQIINQDLNLCRLENVYKSHHCGWKLENVMMILIIIQIKNGINEEIKQLMLK